MSYAEAVRWLYSLTRTGIKPGLATTRRLAELAGNPHARLRFIHVAGTNGKGSTCSFLECVYRRAGLRVGLYTSPHLISFRERVQVDRELIGEAEVGDLLGRLRDLAEADGIEPTFFEYVTVLALMWFAERECELVVLETGLGGRLDSTNIVEPLVSVITSIGMDHAEYLGDTVAQIAGEKAGIIKRGIPVVTQSQPPEVAAVLGGKAREEGSPLTEIPDVADDLCTAGVAGAYRRRNASLARGVVHVLNRTGVLPRVEDADLAPAFAATEWPGRLQVIPRPGRLWVLDGAHNADGFRALLEALPELAGDDGRTLVLGVLGDKDIGEVIPGLAEFFDQVVIVPVRSSRAGDPRALAEAFRRAGAVVRAEADLEDGIAAVNTSVGVVAGSFYLIGEALELLGAVRSDVRSERQLNEWGR